MLPILVQVLPSVLRRTMKTLVFCSQIVFQLIFVCPETHCVLKEPHLTGSGLLGSVSVNRAKLFIPSCSTKLIIVLRVVKPRLVQCRLSSLVHLVSAFSSRLFSSDSK